MNKPLNQKKMKKKLLQNAAREQKNFAGSQNFFHTSISRSLENSDMNKNPLFFRSTLHFGQQQNHSIFFSRVSFSASKFTPIKLIKKGLLQYSSSRKKRQRPNTIQILWIVIKNQERNCWRGY